MATPPVPGHDALVQAYLELSTCNVSDGLDRLRLKGAPHGILPLWPQCRMIAGRAVTMKLVPQGSLSPVLGTLEAIMSGEPGGILVIDNGGRMDVNSWGGIASFTAVRQGLVGVVIDGVTRDVDEMRALGFAAYARGIIQQSIRNRCAFAGCGLQVELAGVAVRQGDLVMADENGVVVVPREHAADVLRVAQECLRTEERIKRWISEGMDPIEAHRRVEYDRMTESKSGG